MKKRTKIIRIIISIILILGIGMGVGVKIHMDHEKQELREKQINYLKVHQQEIVDFIKKDNKKIKSVTFDWSQTQSIDVETGLGSDGEVIFVYGGFNHIEESSWKVGMDLDKEHMPRISTIEIAEDYTVGGDGYE